MRTTWGQEEWQGVRFNEANARRVAEAEADLDRSIAQARRIRTVIRVLVVALACLVLWWLW